LSELGQRLDVLYVAVRDSATVDRQVAFDVAMSEFGYRPLHAEARALAEASVADGDESRLASAAAAFLDAYGYEPGFEQAPERFARLARALDVVRADMRATGLNGEIRLVRPGSSQGNAFVETWAGDQGWTGGISSDEGADDLSALVAVAEQARQAVMESLGYQSTGRVWPACPVHGAGTSPEARAWNRGLVVRRGQRPRGGGDRALERRQLTSSRVPVRDDPEVPGGGTRGEPGVIRIDGRRRRRQA
jgi:hypothetical protein